MSHDLYSFSCPTCATVLSVPRSMAGVQGPCPACGMVLIAPEPPPLAAPQFSPPPSSLYTQAQNPPAYHAPVPTVPTPSPLPSVTAPAGYGAYSPPYSVMPPERSVNQVPAYSPAPVAYHTQPSPAAPGAAAPTLPTSPPSLPAWSPPTLPTLPSPPPMAPPFPPVPMTTGEVPQYVAAGHSSGSAVTAPQHIPATPPLSYQYPSPPNVNQPHPTPLRGPDSLGGSQQGAASGQGYAPAAQSAPARSSGMFGDMPKLDNPAGQPFHTQPTGTDLGATRSLETDTSSFTPRSANPGKRKRLAAICAGVIVIAGGLAAGLAFLPNTFWKKITGNSTVAAELPKAPAPPPAPAGQAPTQPTAGASAPQATKPTSAKPPPTVIPAPAPISVPVTPPQASTAPASPSVTPESSSPSPVVAAPNVTSTPTPEPSPAVAQTTTSSQPATPAPEVRPAVESAPQEQVLAAAASSEPSSLLPPLESEEPATPSYATDQDRNASSRVLQQFLKAKSWSDRLKVSQSSASIRRDMETYYRSRSLSEEQPEAVSFMYSVPVPKGNGVIHIYSIKLRDRKVFPVAVEQTAAGWKVDWAAYVEFKDSRLEQFLAQPTREAQTFRTSITRAHGVGTDNPAPAGKSCFRIEPPIVGVGGYAYVDKRSAISKKLDRIGWDSLGESWMVTLAWDKTSNGIAYVTIKDVVAEDWRLSGDQRVGSK